MDLVDTETGDEPDNHTISQVHKKVIELYYEQRDVIGRVLSINHSECWIFVYLFVCKLCGKGYGQSGNQILNELLHITRSINSIDQPKNFNRGGIYVVLDKMADKGIIKKISAKQRSSDGPGRNGLVGNPGKYFYKAENTDAIMMRVNSALDEKRIEGNALFYSLNMLEETGDGGKL